MVLRPFLTSIVSLVPAMLRLEKGFRQGDPISSYLFIFTLEIGFSFLRNNKIKGINVFSHWFLYSVFADYTDFFKMMEKQ